MRKWKAHLRRLPVPGWKISSEKVVRRGFRATQVKVESSDPQRHRSLSEILQLIERAGLPPRDCREGSNIFQRLGEAEALVHGVPIEKVHFHEVGAVDAIVDIVGASAGFEQLGIEEFVCSALNVGGGRVDTQHGNLPVPAPATAELLRGAPTYSNGIQRELVTPTGAAIVATMASQFGPQPEMTVAAIGLGAGSAELAEQPNVLRLFVGESAARRDDTTLDEDIIVLEANLDDMSPQVYGYFAERALEAGALDVFSIPVQMKKNRPGQLVTVLCKPADREKLSDLLFRETTTLGVRQSQRPAPHFAARKHRRGNFARIDSHENRAPQRPHSKRCARIRRLQENRGGTRRSSEAGAGRSDVSIPEIERGHKVDGEAEWRARKTGTRSPCRMIQV